MGSPISENADKPADVTGKWYDFFSNTDPFTWLRVPSHFAAWGEFSIQFPIPVLLGFVGNAEFGKSAIRRNATTAFNVTGLKVPAPATLANFWAGLNDEHMMYLFFLGNVQSRRVFDNLVDLLQ